jgi:hypothetical protein
MISGKLGRIVCRSAITLAFAIAIGAATMLSPAHADGHHHGEWHEGHWGHWGWRGGVHIFIEEPYPYAYYAAPAPVVVEPPPPVTYAPPPPPVYYAPPPAIVVAPPVVAPSFGVFIGVGHH